MFSGWAVPINAAGSTIRLYDLFILTSVFIFPLLAYREKFSKLTMFFYLALFLLYMKTCLILLYQSVPIIVVLRYCEIFLCFLILPTFINFMRPVSISRAIWIAAALNSIWVGIQVFSGVNLGLYGLSSFGHYGAAFSSGAVFACLFVCLVSLFPVNPVSRIVCVLILLGLIIGVLGVGSRTAVLAVMVFAFFSFKIDLNSQNRWKVIWVVSLIFTPLIVYFLYSFTGTTGTNDIVSRFSNFSESISVRFFDREYPLSVLDALFGSPEKKHFTGYIGIGFNIDSVWFGALLNYGLLFFILVLAPFSILAFRQKMASYYFMLVVMSSGIDVLSTLQVIGVLIITYVLMVKFNAGTRLTVDLVGYR